MLPQPVHDRDHVLHGIAWRRAVTKPWLSPATSNDTTVTSSCDQELQLP
ncbi:hypothetical protein [Streptomyces sp. RerS4]|nr:hypothetical protein [Streptomyces sp. RerS4]UQW99413.1 hypothetical protein M4D82_01880 [Streptomyces sp. RerS4]